MIFSIPIFIEERPAGGGRPPWFIARPLFASEPAHRSEKLSRALTRLTNDLQQRLHALSEEPRHDALAQWTFSPLIAEATLDLRLELASGSHRRSFFLAGYPALGRQLFFTPTLPHLHFEVLPGQSLAERAEAVFTRHLRHLEREGGVNVDDFALLGKARLTVLEFHLSPAAIAKKPRKPAWAALFGDQERMDGGIELRKTGRLLQSMYPDDLDRAVGREREVEELARLLAAADRRPLLLVGPRQVGKTAILHELVWQMRARKGDGFGGGREIWLVSPMRLISGMSFLGEWENRLLAILEHARNHDQVLYFDDLLGLFAAGTSSASDLTVAQVLKPALEKRSVRVVAEITPEAWRILRERDRAFADLFQVMPVNEGPEPETLRILISVVQQLEEEHRCAFDLEVVPTAYELHRRFVCDAAFPGKAAGFLRRLAVRFAGASVSREAVLTEFRELSGVQVALLDERVPLQRAAILESLRHRVVGQDHVLETFADLLVTLKARLNDPKRPLGTLLLLGPTGVGKTQSAKALAEFLFGGNERLLRFDMNEYVDAASVSRLAGTPREPDGLLTGAIRRQPFSVVLFDEIEKAAPEVFDLLLAVLDEGRLTDALGRVADFSQSVILLTSNLGARESRARLGFRAATAAAEADDAVYLSAAEKFFRPEFFNRLDRLVPFRTLERTHLESMVRQLLAEVCAREGLKRRQGLLNVTTQAMNRLVDLGCHPQLGARALKRVIEQQAVRPLAETLARLAPGTPLVASLDVKGDEFSLGLRELAPVARSVFWPEVAAQPRTAADQADWIETVLDGICAALDRIATDLKTSEPDGRIELANLPPEQARYFFCREQYKKVEHLVQAAERVDASPRKPPAVGKIPTAKPVKVVARQYCSGSPKFGRLRAAITLRQDLAEIEPEPVNLPESPLVALLREVALLEAMTAKPADDRPALLVFRAALKMDSPEAGWLARGYRRCLDPIWGVTKTELSNHPRGQIHAMFLKGLNLHRLVPDGIWTILTRRANGDVGAVLMTMRPVGSETEARSLAKSMTQATDRLDPETLGPVIQMVTEHQTLTDYRTGLVIPVSPSAEEFPALFLSSLPLPAEVDAIIRPASPLTT